MSKFVAASLVGVALMLLPAGEAKADDGHCPWMLYRANDQGGEFYNGTTCNSAGTAGCYYETNAAGDELPVVEGDGSRVYYIFRYVNGQWVLQEGTYSSSSACTDAL